MFSHLDAQNRPAMVNVGDKPVKDAADWISLGGTVDALKAIVKAAPPPPPAEAAAPSTDLLSP